MAFRYLNVANSNWNSGRSPTDETNRVDPNLIDQVRKLLLDLPTSGEDILSHQDAAKAYAIIVQNLFEVTSSTERRETIGCLARTLPRSFFSVVEVILGNCS